MDLLTKDTILVSGTQHTIDYTPSGADVDAGDVVVLNSAIPCIATKNITDGTLGSLAWPSGTATYKVKKVGGGGVTFAVGAPVYWNASTGATATGTDDLMGYAVAAAVDAATEVVIVHTI